MKTELHCHECNKFFQVEFDDTINGNHVVNCPNCQHEHCRVIKDGIVTGDRWDQRNGNTIQAVWISASATSTAAHSHSLSWGGTSGGLYLQNIWANTTSTSTY